MAGEVTVTFDPPPERLAQVIERAQRELRLSLPEAVRMAAYYLARSLGASTKSAPKTRRLKKRTAGGIREFPRRWFPSYVEIYGANGQLRPHFIRAGNETTDPARTIARRGLAKSSWLWMLSSLGRPQKAPQKPIAGATRVTKIPDLANPGWILENRLHYIESAMKHSGRAPVETAFARAASAGNKAIDRRKKRP